MVTPEQQALPDTPIPQENGYGRESCSLTEFVGTAIGDTLGLVIVNVGCRVAGGDEARKRYRLSGILGARTGAGPQHHGRR